MKVDNFQLKRVIRDKYAWPGGYEMFGITSDGAVLCCDCMRKEFRQIAWSRLHDVNDGWKVEAIGHDGELDDTTYCDHCNKFLKEGE